MDLYRQLSDIKSVTLAAERVELNEVQMGVFLLSVFSSLHPKRSE